MLKSLYSKLSIVLLTTFFILGILLIAAIEFSTRMLQAETSQKLHLELAEHIVSDMELFKDGDLDPKAIKEAFHMMMILGPSIELYVLDNKGTIIAYDAPAQKIKIDKVSLAPIKKFIAEGAQLPILGDDPRSLKKKKIFSAATIDDEQSGYLYIIIGGEQYDSIASVLQANHVLRISAGIVFAAFLFAAIVSLLLFYSMTKPIRRLSDDMQKFIASGFQTLPTTKTSYKPGKDEIHTLQNSFHSLANKVVSQFKSLETKDQQRRELFAQISHDLRTPLAGLQGYLETLSLKQKSLTDIQRGEFLEISTKQTQQLSKLIDDIFELARLEGNDIKFEAESFSLCELTNDIVQKLKFFAEEKKITIKFDHNQNISNVVADIGKIERVITNLLENSIHYTPSQGHIDISITPKKTANIIKFEIRDTGRGIEKDDMPHIFDPYYRASSSVNNNQKGSGLGLAISQRLLSLHNSSLTIDSKTGAGTRASFELKSEPSND